jgi:hypothetical protein
VVCCVVCGVVCCGLELCVVFNDLVWPGVVCGVLCSVWSGLI